MKIELRYFVKENSYYIQMVSSEYSHIEKQLKRIRKQLDHLKNRASSEFFYLSKQIDILRKQKSQCQSFVKVNPNDISGRIKSRPMYHTPMNITVLPTEEYFALIGELQRRSEMQE